MLQILCDVLVVYFNLLKFLLKRRFRKELFILVLAKRNQELCSFEKGHELSEICFIAVFDAFFSQVTESNLYKRLDRFV